MVEIEEYRDKLKKKTCSMKEFAKVIDVSYAKALRISHLPYITFKMRNP